MAQSGFTPIQLYRTATASATPTAGNLADGELAINTNDGKLFYKDSGGTVQLLASKAGASGDVVGPASSTDNAVVRFDGTTGKLVQNSVVTIADSTGDVAGVGALTASGAVTLSGGTANGVAYLNGSKVLTTGSALVYDGTILRVNGSTTSGLRLASNSAASNGFNIYNDSTTDIAYLTNFYNGSMVFGINNTEQMRLTSTGLGVGTTSPTDKLNVGAFSGNNVVTIGAGTTGTSSVYFGDGTGADRYRGYIDYEHTNDRFVLGTAGTGKVTLNSSGNLGLGVTPSAWDLGKAIEVGTVGNSIWGVGSSNMVIGSNIYYASSSYKYANTAAASAYQQAGGVHYWYNAASGTAGNTISFTQAMTLDASGNLGVGTTSPGVSGIDILRSGGTSTYVRTSDGTYTMLSGVAPALGGALIGTTTNHPVLFYSNNTERARITSGGDLLVGRTSAGLTTAGAGVIKNAGGAYLEVVQGTNGVACMYLNQSNGSGTQTVADFRYNNTQVGTINVTSTACTYNNLSDYRLKTVIGSVSGAGARIDALEPVEYEWKVNGARTRGFLAHKFQEVYPQSVAGEKDAVDAKGNPVYQSMQASTSEVIADLVAEIQSLRKRLAAAGIA